MIQITIRTVKTPVEIRHIEDSFLSSARDMQKIAAAAFGENVEFSVSIPEHGIFYNDVSRKA